MGLGYGYSGEDNNRHQWTNKEARKIREYRHAGFSYRDLQKLFGGSIASLNEVCLGKTYPRAGGPVAAPVYTYHRSVIK
jgi:hypothetical protein